MTFDIDWSDNTRPQKAQVRDIVFRALGTRENTLFLPGNGCMCVKSALSHRAINNNTMVHAVERDPQTAEIIKDKLTKMGVSHSIHIGELAKFQAISLDYAFLDLMGPLDESLALWLRELVSGAAENFALTLTLTYNWRNAFFMRECSAFFDQNQHLIYDMRDKIGIVDTYIITTLCVLRSIFKGYDFLLEPPILYQDTRMSMMTFHLSEFKTDDGDQGWPSLTEILANKEDTMSTESAKKAWETRRANDQAVIAAEAELAAKRSRAAYKAWETRRAGGGRVRIR